MIEEERPYRYELKYVLKASDLGSFYSILYTHPAGFNKLFPDRVINNIYFDDVDFNSCQDNLFGISERVKIRYRWYGDIKSFSTGIVEKKIKNNTLGTKEFIKIRTPFSLDELSREVNALSSNSMVFPSLQNAYQRSYFIDRDLKFRMTIDRNLSFHYPDSILENMSQAAFQDDRIIVEVKFDVEDYAFFDKISDAFPYRLSKHSKYVTGLINLVY